MTTPNDTILMNQAGTKTYFDKPGAVEALQYWVDLSAKHKVMPSGVIEWGTTPKDFLEQKAAMIWTTTGNLTNLRANASFPFGVAMLPAAKHPGSPTGGGNFYVFNKTTPEQQKAALKFIRWSTNATRGAMEYRYRLRGNPSGCMGYPGNEEVPARSSGRWCGT